jgi:metal-responsive CopG/Arc/MetJ family transcriptional regulator
MPIISLSVEKETINKLDEIAKKKFKGNRSMAFHYLVNNCPDN